MFILCSGHSLVSPYVAVLVHALHHGRWSLQSRASFNILSMFVFKFQITHVKLKKAAVMTYGGGGGQ